MRGYREENVYVFDSFRKIKNYKDFTISLGFRSCDESLKFIRLLDAQGDELSNLSILNVSEKDLKWHRDSIKFLFLKSKGVNFSKTLLILENSLTFSKNHLKVSQIIPINFFLRIKKVLKILLFFAAFTKVRFMFFILKKRLFLLGGRTDLNVRKSTSDLSSPTIRNCWGAKI